MENNNKKYKSKPDLSRAKTFLKQGESSASFIPSQPQPPAKKDRTRRLHRSNGKNRSSTSSKTATASASDISNSKSFITLNQDASEEETVSISSRSRTELDEEMKEEEVIISDKDTEISQLIQDVISQNDKNKGKYGNMYGSMQAKEAQLQAMDTT
jgi:hypothetical protein